jgi:hypothetical protein
MPGSNASSNYQDDIFSVVQKRFSDVDNILLRRGPVPDVLAQITSSKAVKETKMARPQCNTIHLKLLKVGAVIIKNSRCIRFLLTSAYPSN